jgi:hypothetical protein
MCRLLALACMLLFRVHKCSAAGCMTLPVAARANAELHPSLCNSTKSHAPEGRLLVSKLPAAGCMLQS